MTRQQRGQAMTEYALLVGVLAAVLFVPWGPLGNRSVFMLFIEAFGIYIDSYHTVITLPIP